MVGVAGVIDARVRDSTAVAAIWPATVLDAVFFDGDLSVVGALKDLVCWAPKVRPGGLMLIHDGADQPPSLRDLIEWLKDTDGLSHLGQSVHCSVS